MTNIKAIKIQDFLDKDELTKFWSKVEIPKDLKKCWIWTGAIKDNTKENSYGVINLSNKKDPDKKRSTILAHRISWVIYNRKEPEGVIDHLCFNRRCVNPKHLSDVSWSENSARHEQQFLPFCKNGHARTEDSMGKNSQGHNICKDCARQKDRDRYKAKYAKEKLKYTHTSEMRDFARDPKLNWDKVEEIRNKYSTGNFSQSKLAVEYTVSKTMIGHIVNNKAWVKDV